MSKLTHRLGVLVAIALLAFCFQARAADDQVQVVSESALGSFWLPDPARPKSPPQYPIDALKSGAEGCVAIALEIHGDGSVSNVRVWRSNLTNVSPAKEIERSAMLDVAQWHFVPAPGNKGRTPVYTYQIMTFTIGGTGDSRREKEVWAKCEMTDFPQQVQAMINSAQAGKKP